MEEPPDASFMSSLERAHPQSETVGKVRASALPAEQHHPTIHNPQRGSDCEPSGGPVRDVGAPDAGLAGNAMREASQHDEDRRAKRPGRTSLH
jgi:hypothetical protein